MNNYKIDTIEWNELVTMKFLLASREDQNSALNGSFVSHNDYLSFSDKCKQYILCTRNIDKQSTKMFK